MALMQSNDPRTIRAQTEHAHKMYDNSISRNTRINYKSDLRRFQAEGYQLPAHPDDVVSYLNCLAKEYNPRTLERHLKALRFWHKINKFVDPTDDVLVKRLLKGIKNTYTTPLKKAKPFTINDMIAIDKYYMSLGRLSSYRNNALIQLGFFGAFRRSEVVKLKFEDVKFTKEGAEITITQSKTDQEGLGQMCAIPYMVGALCPVKILKDWLEVSKIKSGYIFRPVSRNSVMKEDKPIHVEMLYLAIKTAAVGAELDEPERYSGHSLRRGFATAAAQNGASWQSIMRHGRWENVATVQGYIEEATMFVDNAASCLDIPYTKSECESED